MKGDKGLEAFRSYALFSNPKSISANQLGAHTGQKYHLVRPLQC